MKVLFIGGTGQISSAIVRKLAKEKDVEVWLLNRGNRPAPEGVWRYNGGWWYQYPDGSYPVNCWKQIDGEWYIKTEEDDGED